MNPRCFPLQIIPILTILKTIKRLTMTSIHLVVWIIVTYRDFMGGCFSKTHVENFEVQMLQFIIPLSVQFSHSVVSHSLRPHGLQHARPPCPSPTPGVYSNPCPLSRWCHLTISSSVVPFFSCLQSFPSSGSFQMSQLSHQVAKILAYQLQHKSLQWTPRTDLLKNGLVGPPCSPRDSQESSPTPQFKASILQRSAFFTFQLPHPSMTTQ